MLNIEYIKGNNYNRYKICNLLPQRGRVGGDTDARAAKPQLLAEAPGEGGRARGLGETTYFIRKPTYSNRKIDIKNKNILLILY